MIMKRKETALKCLSKQIDDLKKSYKLIEDIPMNIPLEIIINKKYPSTKDHMAIFIPMSFNKESIRGELLAINYHCYDTRWNAKRFSGEKFNYTIKLRHIKGYKPFNAENAALILGYEFISKDFKSMYFNR